GYLRDAGYAFGSTLVTVLSHHIKQPDDLFTNTGQKVSPANFYYNFDWWRTTQRDVIDRLDLSYDPLALTDELEAKVLKPMLDVVPLFGAASGMSLTRLFTRLSPAD